MHQKTQHSFFYKEITLCKLIQKKYLANKETATWTESIGQSILDSKQLK